MIKKCKHQLDSNSVHFVEGKGYLGTCELCGAKLVIGRRVRPVQRTYKDHMSKKERLRLRRMENGNN